MVLVVHLPLYNSSEHEIGVVGSIVCTVQCVILVGSIFPTERALKRNFTKDGVRR